MQGRGKSIEERREERREKEGIARKREVRTGRKRDERKEERLEEKLRRKMVEEEK